MLWEEFESFLHFLNPGNEPLAHPVLAISEVHFADVDHYVKSSQFSRVWKLLFDDLALTKHVF